MAAAYGLQGRLRKAVAALLVLAAMAGSLVQPATASPIRLLVLGDSLTAGYGLAHAEGFQVQLAAALAAAGRQVRIIDGAVSCDTTQDGRDRLAWVLGGGADAAIVELGANDGLRGVDPAVIQANLTAILDTLAARHIPVLLCGIYAPPNMGPDYERAFNAVFERLGHRPVVLFDPFFLADVAEDPALNQADGLHPNPEGVRRIVIRLLPLVEKLLDEVKTG
jgi:acyl-CoA thioesterase I